jgi:hypothetical protein
MLALADPAFNFSVPLASASSGRSTTKPFI